MDLAVYALVLSRHRKLVGIGLLLAFALALFSVARFELDGVKPSVSYQDDEVWISASTLFVTEEGFPWGRATLDETQGDPGRYPGLAQLYAALATSDAVKQAVMVDAPRNGRYEAEVVRSADSTVLPLVYMNGYGPSPGTAEEMANRSAEIFRRYLSTQQARSGIPPGQRVKVSLLSTASEAEVFAGRSWARPVFVFFLVITVFVALAFVLDNMRGSDPRPEGWRTALGTLFRRPSMGAISLPRRLGGAGSPAGLPSSAGEPSVPTAAGRRSAKSSKGGEFRSGESVDPGRSLGDDPPAKRRSA